jgi:hypothetical protein
MNRVFAASFVLLLSCLAVVGAAASDEDLKTRFGELTTNDDNVLLFKGKPISPQVRAPNGISTVEKFEIDASDVLLLVEHGGTACPAKFWFVSVSADSAKATSRFGTCSDQFRTSRTGGTITVTMPGFLGPFEPAPARAKAAKERHVFTFSNGLLTENGKPVNNKPGT